MIDYEEFLESYSIASAVYNEIGNGTLKTLPVKVFDKIDKAVSRAIIVGILVSKYNITEVSEEEMNDIIETLFTKLMAQNH